MTNRHVERLFKEAVQAMKEVEAITGENMTPRERDHIWSVVNDPGMPATTMIHCSSGRSISKREAAPMFGIQLVEEDSVNHPSHYTAYKGLEIIDLTEQMNFNRGNAVKYIARAGLKNKNTEIEDLEKALWYIRREIDRIRG